MSGVKTTGRAVPGPYHAVGARRGRALPGPERLPQDTSP